MAHPGQPQLTESSILMSFLLIPSPLSTLLTYKQFLSTCVPASCRSHPHIKRLYRDLQFQRNIDVDTVRENIERECARQPLLKARLQKQISDQDDDHRDISTASLQPGQKRKRHTSKPADHNSDTIRRKAAAENEDDNENGNDDDDDDDDDTADVQKAESHSQLLNPIDMVVDKVISESTLHPSVHHDPRPLRPSRASSSHPRSQSLETQQQLNTSASPSGGFVSIPTSTTAIHHDIKSLLSAMESSISTLETEISALDSTNSSMMDQMNEVVGNLSDLRYGRFARPSGGAEDDTVEKDMVRALEEFVEEAGKAVERSSASSAPEA